MSSDCCHSFMGTNHDMFLAWMTQNFRSYRMGRVRGPAAAVHRQQPGKAL